MSAIFEPTGRAKEYSPYACNLYLSCTHKCKYCYVPNYHQGEVGSKESYFSTLPKPIKNVLRELKKDLKAKKYEKQVFLSFVGDVYCNSGDDNKTTRKALKLFLKHNTPVAILTKAGSRCLKDLKLFKKFGNNITVGATLTFMDEAKSKEWESGAALPADRLAALKTLHDNGIKTFVSLEPVIEPEETLKLIRKTLEDNSVDHYKIGKLNNYMDMDKGIDWETFLQDCFALLRPANKQIYIKKHLRDLSPNTQLSAQEINPEEYIVKTCN